MFDRFLTIRLYKKGEIRYKLQNLYNLTVESVLHLGRTGADLAFYWGNKLLKRFHQIDIEQKTVLFWARYQIFFKKISFCGRHLTKNLLFLR